LNVGSIAVVHLELLTSALGAKEWYCSRLILATILILTLGTACGGDESTSTETATPSPTQQTPVSATVAPTSMPAATAAPSVTPITENLERSFREFARSLSGPLNQKDAGFFRSRLQTRHVVCGPLDVNRMGEGLGCQMVGQEFDGVSLSVWRSDRGDYVTVPQAMALIESLWSQAVPGASDQFGDSMARPYAVNFPDLSMPPEAPRLYTVVLTAIHNQPIGGFQNAPRRANLLMHWQLVDGQWRLAGLMDNFSFGTLGQDFLEPTQEGRNYLQRWERLTP
jgi:hypothetical protein